MRHQVPPPDEQRCQATVIGHDGRCPNAWTVLRLIGSDYTKNIVSAHPELNIRLCDHHALVASDPTKP